MPPKTPRKRLDLLLVERGLAESRQKAQAMILAGEVTLMPSALKRRNGNPSRRMRASKFTVACRSTPAAPASSSKARWKIFASTRRGKICLDVGSSTGGFTDCLLQQGAARVYAVDVNTDQLAWKLREDAA